MSTLSPAHIALARKIAARYHSPSHTADDLAQEAILALALALPVYDPTRHLCPVEAYLATCARSHLSRLVRCDQGRQAREEPLGDDWLDNKPGPEEFAERADILEHARAVLSGWEADVVALQAAGHGTQHIAGALGITAALVRMYRARAVARLRSEIL